MITVRNTGLWFVSLLLSVSLFSSLYGRLYGIASFAFVFRTTMIFALPVACLCAPVVLAVSGRKKGTRIIVLAGSVIGPVCVALLAGLAEARGKQAVWDDSGGNGFGIVAELASAAIVGFLTTIIYIIALKLIQGLSASAK